MRQYDLVEADAVELGEMLAGKAGDLCILSHARGTDCERLRLVTQKGAQPAPAGIGIRKGIEPQELREEFVQRVLRIVMREPATADECVERVAVLREHFVQRAARLGQGLLRQGELWRRREPEHSSRRRPQVRR